MVKQDAADRRGKENGCTQKCRAARRGEGE
jgi:hypothetical protein